MIAAALVLAVLLWSPFTREMVTPEVLDQQGLVEYGATWWIVKPVVTGEGLAPAAPAAPTDLTLS